MVNHIHGTSWLDQWQRIYRWRDRVAAARDGLPHDGLGRDACADEAFALMQAIHHLGDWLHNDPSAPVTLDQVKAWMYHTPGEAAHLRIAADVANGSKHHALTTSWGGKTRERAQVVRNDVTVHVGVSVSYTFWVEGVVDGRPLSIEVVALADACIAEWAEFLVKHGVDEAYLRSQYDLDRGITERAPVDEQGSDASGAKPVTEDEHPKPDTTLETLAGLRPAFTKDGTVTAGTPPASTTAAPPWCSHESPSPATGASPGSSRSRQWPPPAWRPT